MVLIWVSGQKPLRLHASTVFIWAAPIWQVTYRILLLINIIDVIQCWKHLDFSPGYEWCRSFTCGHQDGPHHAGRQSKQHFKVAFVTLAWRQSCQTLGVACVLQVIQQDFKSSEPEDGRRIDFLYEMISRFLDTEGMAASLSSIVLPEFKRRKHECACWLAGLFPWPNFLSDSS